MMRFESKSLFFVRSIYSETKKEKFFYKYLLNQSTRHLSKSPTSRKQNKTIILKPANFPKSSSFNYVNKMNYKSKEERTKPWIETEQSNESQGYFQHSFIHINTTDDTNKIMEALSEKSLETNIIDKIRLTNKSSETPSKNPLHLPALTKDSTRNKNGYLKADSNSMELTEKITPTVSLQLSDKNGYQKKNVDQETNRDSTKLTDRITTAINYDSYINPETTLKILSNLQKSTKVSVLDRDSMELNYKTYYDLYKETLSKRRGSETDDTTKNKGRNNLWTSEQDKILLQAVKKHGMQWRLISKTYFGSARSKKFLQSRYNNLNHWSQEDRTEKSKSGRKMWTSEQEETLFQAVNKHGEQWQLISEMYFNSARTEGAIRARYKKLDYWPQEDDDILKKIITRLNTREGEMFLKLIKERDSDKITSRWKLLNNEFKKSNVPNDIKF
ncbi:hypothetical protein Glove_216g183 [Diversispora epigaea]|uniref:Myb-like domain-containing protein n=1 Tax=Diversispora epigaea TaxID=1348612 RepID=A0A397IH43_9GLOM|nr:hypothetical protein Glove_216g183 [Diversispora epigaea]